VITLLLILVLTGSTNIEDSLHNELDLEIRMTTIGTLNKHYIKNHDYNGARDFLETYENKVEWNDQAIIQVLIGDNLLYAGSLLGAREKYLTVVGRYTKSPAANDALERLYLLETARTDTNTLKRLAYVLGRLYCEQWMIAEDSLKQLLETKLRLHAYFHLALLYKETGDIPLAMSMLDALENEYPAHKLLAVPLLRAEIYLDSENPDGARAVLEDLIIQYPQSIHAVRARMLLKTIQ